MSRDFIGVHGVSDPAGALRALGVEAAWSDRQVAFGGAPVWTDASGTVVVSGEVTLDNEDALRRVLGCPAARGGSLLAELYRRDGAHAGQRALGMFAVAVWDARAGRLLLLRDGVGARTLYYASDGRGCWFASRLRALRRTPAVSSSISLTALRNYLTCAFVPGDETMWRDAHELRPGTALSVPEGEVVSFWEPSEGACEPDAPLETHAARLRPLLEDAVRARLPASGPAGVFLSGGLDSSLVTALAARYAPGPVHTFAIHFGPPYPNELTWSVMAAAHCGTRHHVLELPGALIRDTLAETMAALDDPIGDPLTTPNLLLGRAAARETGVVLNGEGGDPCFGGPKNGPMLLHELYGAGAGREAAYLRSFQKCYDDLPCLLTPEVQAALIGAPSQEELVAPFLGGAGPGARASVENGDAAAPAMTHYLNRLMYLNVRLKGADHILTKVNNLTSANGILGRSPLFDRRIVEASFAIPPEHKLAGATEKAVLKRTVADLLPEAILNRPKSGMLVPVQAWFQHDLRRFARGLLLDRRARTRPYLDRDTVRAWLDYRGNLWPRHGVKLWLVLTLEEWLRAQE
jgi:asparagine synthase (glutamine-hydrolysing)